MRQAWTDAGPSAVDAGVYVQRPRNGSAAANAGLRQGDVVVAVDDREVKTYADLQSAVRNHEPGETFRLKVQRGPDERHDIAVIRP